jgi:hypothetical protein
MSEPSEPLPRWVSVFAICAGVLLALFVAVHLAGGGFRHHLGAPKAAPAPVAPGR